MMRTPLQYMIREAVKAFFVIAAIALLLVAVVVFWGCSKQGETPAPPRSPVTSEVKKATTVVQTSAPDLAPAAAQKYKRDLIGMAHEVWGLNAPTPVFGAQVQQESGWNANARSPVGAQGLAQFMPSTADWIDDVYPDLYPNQPYNPAWALRGLVRYDKHLWDRIDAATECDRMAFSLSAFNGGAKWVYSDQKLAATMGDDPRHYWGSVEKVNAGRNAAAWQENRGYPQRIVKVLQPKYATWGKTLCG